MFHCLIPFPVNFSNDLVSSVMKRGSNGCVKDQNLPVFVLKWTFTCVTLVFAPYLSLCIFDQEVLSAVVSQSLAGWLAGSEWAGSCSSGGEARTALPAGSVRSPAKPRRRDLCQCRIGAENEKKIFCRCLKACLRRQSRLSRAYRCLEVQQCSHECFPS